MCVNKLRLGGLPALRRCRIAFRVQGAGDRAFLHLSEASFDRQRNSLHELTLQGISRNIHVLNLGWHLVTLPALRCLAIQNLGVTNLNWLESSWESPPAAPVHSLSLDDNAGLQLNAKAAAALLNMTALRKLSMRKRVGHSYTIGNSFAGHGGSVPWWAAVWTADSVRCIARVVAARPALQLCF